MAAISLRVRQPTSTEVAIAAAINEDGGARFRGLQEKWFPLIKDAYSTKKENGRRSHYGFSGAGGGFGERCERALWLRWRWQNRDDFSYIPENANAQAKVDKARQQRLVNRGHLEEARFMALLEMIGVHIDEPKDGQERVSMFYGHSGSALDAVLYNVPCIPNEWSLGEFKTSNDKNFKELKKKGCFESKQSHYVQMQLCMAVRGIHKTLYMVVNKNDDEIYTEVIEYDEIFAMKEVALIHKIIFSNTPGAKISNDPSWFTCKFCDCYAVCQVKEYVPERTCRGCVAGTPDTESSAWRCGAVTGLPMIPKEVISVGCDRHLPLTY